MKSLSIRGISIALLLIVMITSLCGCYDKAACDCIIDNADLISRALIERDVDSLIGFSDSKHNKMSTSPFLSRLHYDNSLDADKLSFVETVRESISYRVDPGSADAATRDGTGVVDVYFSMVDYESVLESAEENIDNSILLRTLNVEDKRSEMRVSLSFVYEDGEWKLSNLNDVFNSVYSFLDVDIASSVNILDAVSGGYWCFCDSDVPPQYVNTSEIDLDLQLETTRGKIDTSEVYYVVSLNGENIYVSPPGYTEGIYGIEQGAQVNRFGYMYSGEYLIAFFDGNDELIYFDTAVVDELKVREDQVDLD
jgi:hypothetical protein